MPELQHKLHTRFIMFDKMSLSAQCYWYVSLNNIIGNSEKTYKKIHKRPD
jgi:hypothetical protein